MCRMAVWLSPSRPSTEPEEQLVPPVVISQCMLLVARPPLGFGSKMCWQPAADVSDLRVLTAGTIRLTCTEEMTNPAGVSA